MKKILAIVLVLLMALSLFACNKETTPEDTTSEAPAETSSEAPSNVPDVPSAEPTVNPTGGEIGMYDPDYDYASNTTYTVQYVVLATQGLYEAFSDAFAHWATMMNINYLGMQEYGGDKDAYLSNLPTLAENCDGLLIDPDSQMYTRCAEILDEVGCPWMGCMAAPRDYEAEDMPLLHPFVGFDNYQVGTIFPPKLLEYKEMLWPDVPLEEFGFIEVDFSVAFPLKQREMGCYDTLMTLAPDMAENRYFIADTAINTFDVDTSSQVVSTVLSQNPGIEYWLVFAEVDDMAKGAAAALDTMGLTDNSCVMTFGGTGLQIQWDAGVQDAWRAACYLPQTIYAEPIIGALYAFMNGDATPETLWPNWVNANDAGTSGSYASRLLPYYWIEYDNYQTVIRWSDIYAGSDYYPEYSSEGITRDTYSSQVIVPDYYAG